MALRLGQVLGDQCGRGEDLQDLRLLGHGGQALHEPEPGRQGRGTAAIYSARPSNHAASAR